MQAILDRYPLLKSVGRYSTEAEVIADYINMVDTVKAEAVQNSYHSRKPLPALSSIVVKSSCVVHGTFSIKQNSAPRSSKDI
jgi:hypothetical protein